VEGRSLALKSPPSLRAGEDVHQPSASKAGSPCCCWGAALGAGGPPKCSAVIATAASSSSSSSSGGLRVAQDRGSCQRLTGRPRGCLRSAKASCSCRGRGASAISTGAGAALRSRLGRYRPAGTPAAQAREGKAMGEAGTWSLSAPGRRAGCRAPGAGWPCLAAGVSPDGRVPSPPAQPRSFHQQPRSFHQQPRSFHEQPRSFHQQPRSFHQQPRSFHQQPLKARVLPLTWAKGSRRTSSQQTSRWEETKGMCGLQGQRSSAGTCGAGWYHRAG